jgi:hypothetical protein
MRINIGAIPHIFQRYNTLGDWQFYDNDGTLTIRVSDTGDYRMNAALAIHEFAEAILCKARGITQQQVDRWDLAHLEDPDPGSIEGCPYHDQHIGAAIIENIFLKMLGIKDAEYDERTLKCQQSTQSS